MTKTENSSQLNIGEYVKMSVDAGVAPLEPVFIPILNIISGQTIAYRSQTVIHSVIMGDMPEDIYTVVSDKPELREEMLLHNMWHVAGTVKKLQDLERRLAFITVRCPEGMADFGDIYSIVAKVLSKNPTVYPNRIVIDFPAALLERNIEKARKLINDIKILKVRTSISGCGKPDFPAMKLIELKPDMLFLDPKFTCWAGNRNKPQVFTAFVSYVKSMGIEVYAVANPEQRMALRSANCDGYVKIGENAISEDELIARKEDV